jgi:Rod binding domain-containing protein
MSSFAASPALSGNTFSGNSLSNAALSNNALRLQATAAKPNTPEAKARATAQDFEAVFLNSMFQQMFTGLDKEGPFGGTPSTGPWRSFLTDEYAKSFAKAGGIGIADHVYKTLLSQQEARSH